MKRKFILYPAVALALMTSVSLSSCVDTDEPDSIADLRKAKAEEIRANAALLSAQSEVEKAYVAVVNAKAAYENASAKKEEVEAAVREYKAAWEKADYEKKTALLTATTEQEIEAAKAMEEATLVGEKAKLEKAVYEYEQAVREYKAKTELLDEYYKNELKKEQLAQKEAADLNDAKEYELANTKTSTELGYVQEVTNQIREVNAKQKALAKANEDLVDALKDSDPQSDVDEAQQAYDNAVAAKEQAEALFDAGDFSKIVEEYQKLKTLSESTDELVKQYDLQIARLQAELVPLNDKKTELNTAYTEAKTATADAKSNGTTKAQNDIDAWVNKEVTPKYAVANAVLKTLLEGEGLTFTNGEWSGAKVKQSEYENATKDLKDAANKFAKDQMYQNVETYNKVYASFTANLANKTTEFNTEKTKWVTAVKKYQAEVAKYGNPTNGPDKPTVDAACANARDAAIELFKPYATSTNFMKFLSENIINDVEGYLKANGIALQTYDETTFGKYFVYAETKKSVESGSDYTKIMSAADDLVKKIEGDVKNINDETQKLKDAKDAVNSSDAVKAAEKKENDAKKAFDDYKKDKIDPIQDKIDSLTIVQSKVNLTKDSCEYIYNALDVFEVTLADKDLNEQKYKASEIAQGDLQKAKDKALEPLLAAIATAADNLNKKKALLEAYKAENYKDAKFQAIRDAKEAVQTAEEALADATDELNRLKTVYGVE